MSEQRGFTIIELLLALAMLSLVLVAVVTLQQQGQLAFVSGSARVQGQQNARVALDRMARELRTSEGMVSAVNCNTAATDVTFRSPDPSLPPWVTPPTMLTYRYWRSGDNLQRSVNSVQETLIAGVTGFQIQCFAADGSPTAVASQVRAASITITTVPEANPTYAPARQVTVLASQVRLRNIP